MSAVGIHHNRDGIITWIVDLDDGRTAYVSSYVPRDITEPHRITYRMPRTVMLVPEPPPSPELSHVRPMPSLYLRCHVDDKIYASVTAMQRNVRDFGTTDVWMTPELRCYYNLYVELMAHVCVCHATPMKVYFLNDHQTCDRRSAPITPKIYNELEKPRFHQGGFRPWLFSIETTIDGNVRELYRIPTLTPKHRLPPPQHFHNESVFVHFPIVVRHQLPEQRFTAERVLLEQYRPTAEAQVSPAYDVPATSAAPMAGYSNSSPVDAEPSEPDAESDAPTYYNAHSVQIPIELYHYLVGFHARVMSAQSMAQATLPTCNSASQANL